MKILLSITLLILASTSSYGAFQNGNRSSDGGGYNSNSDGYKTDSRNGGYRVDDSYEYDLDDNAANPEIQEKENNTSKAASPAPATAATKAKEEKPIAEVPKSNPDAGKKIQKVTRGDVVTYEWATPNKVTQNDQGVQTEIIEVAAAPSRHSSGFGGASQTKQSQWESQFTMFPQDENGWSLVKPQVDSRIIFVSSSEGNDSKAQAYFSKDIDNPYNPSKKIVAFKTIEEAVKLVRDGYPDWVLLKKGDEWDLEEESGIFLPSGKSTQAPLVISSYGTSDVRPLINTGTGYAFRLHKSRSFVSIIGLEFYANKRDPNSAYFVGWDNVGNPIGFLSVGIPSTKYANKEAKSKHIIQSIHVEGNIFNFFASGMVVNGGVPQKNIVIRRNQFLNSYATARHAQGIFISTASMLLEENLFDHNGWYQQNYGEASDKKKGQATMFNHNIYASSMTNTIMDGNIFSRASSMGIKLTSNSDSGQNTVKAENITISDNLFLEGEIGISAGGNKDYKNGYRWRNMKITDNVMLHIGNAQPTRRTLAWHIGVQDWDGGVVSNNHLLFNDNVKVGNVSGIKVSGFSSNVSVTKNTLRGLRGKSEQMVYQVENEAQENINMEQSSVSIDAVNKASRRDLTSYFNVSDGSNGIARLVEKAKTQSKGSWNTSFTASEINKYLTE